MGTPRPLTWDRGSALTYVLNSLGAMALSAVSVIFFQDREHDASEILAGTAFLVALAWVLSFVVAGTPLRRPQLDTQPDAAPGTQDADEVDVTVPGTAVQPELALSR
ncbi:MAG TPA: hypothetical protein VF867_11935 [Arthrobacter sp.]